MRKNGEYQDKGWQDAGLQVFKTVLRTVYVNSKKVRRRERGRPRVLPQGGSIYAAMAG